MRKLLLLTALLLLSIFIAWQFVEARPLEIRFDSPCAITVTEEK